MPTLFGTGRGYYVRTEGEFDEAIKAALAETEYFTLIEAGTRQIGYVTRTCSLGRADVGEDLKTGDKSPYYEPVRSYSAAIFSRKNPVQKGTCSSDSPCNTTAPS